VRAIASDKSGIHCAAFSIPADRLAKARAGLDSVHTLRVSKEKAREYDNQNEIQEHIKKKLNKMKKYTKNNNKISCLDEEENTQDKMANRNEENTGTVNEHEGCVGIVHLAHGGPVPWIRYE
jgi:hypothetical protein